MAHRTLSSEPVHQSLASALVHITDAAKDLKLAQKLIHKQGLAGPLNGNIQGVLDILEQGQNDVERAALAWIEHSA